MTSFNEFDKKIGIAYSYDTGDGILVGCDKSTCAMKIESAIQSGYTLTIGKAV